MKLSLIFQILISFSPDFVIKNKTKQSTLYNILRLKISYYLEFIKKQQQNIDQRVISSEKSLIKTNKQQKQQQQQQQHPICYEGFYKAKRFEYQSRTRFVLSFFSCPLRINSVIKKKKMFFLLPRCWQVEKEFDLKKALKIIKDQTWT